MINQKNYNVVIKYFVLLLTISILLSCAKHSYYITKIEGKKIGIAPTFAADSAIVKYVQPYKTKIDADLSETLAYNPEILDKTGEWQTNIGCFLADITLEKSNPIFQKRENKSIDFCMLNAGGIRTIIPKGNVTQRTAYEVQPFENTTVVVGLKTEQVLELINYIITEKKPHPVSGLKFTISKDNAPKDIIIQGKPIENNKVYYVLTSDYLSNGGDNMNFFKTNTLRVDLDYKLRNIIIDYFKDVDTLKINKDVRINKEK